MNVYVMQVALALSRLGLKVDILTSAPEWSRPAMLRLGARTRLVSVPDPSWLARRELALPRYDVVHSHYWMSAEPARLVADRSSARHIHTFHTYGHLKNSMMAPGDAREPDDRLAAERSIVRDVDAVIVSTESERLQVMTALAGDERRIHVCAPGVETARFRPGDRRAARARWALGDDVVFVHVGRIQPLKGITLALGALRDLTANMSLRCSLLLAGEPSGIRGRQALDQLRRHAACLPAGASARLLGRISRAALPSLFAAADAAVVCSRTESFCLAALEAQACGVPVVGTPVGGLPEFVIEGESGYLVGRDHEAFADRLERTLVGGRSRRRMVAASLESARRFSWATTAGAIREIYEV
jgi:D-inositol-3-phosphate glycosyltransferase